MDYFIFRARANLLNCQDIWMYCRLDQSYDCCCSCDMGLLGFLVVYFLFFAVTLTAVVQTRNGILRWRCV